MTVTKAILLEDYYAPTFHVPVLAAGSCHRTPRRAPAGYTPLFRTTHPEPWRPGATRLSERRRRFTALSRA